jgi:hypothetical protein
MNVLIFRPTPGGFVKGQWSLESFHAGCNLARCTRYNDGETTLAVARIMVLIVILVALALFGWLALAGLLPPLGSES